MLILLFFIFTPFFKINFFIIVFFLETIYWILIVQSFLQRSYPVFFLRIVCFSAIERATFFSILISFLSKNKIDFF